MKQLTDFDIRLIHVFKTVVECGGITPAETELNISRSTISIHLSNLEARLNLKLAQRGRAGFSLTTEGQAVYSASLELNHALGDFSRLVSGLKTELKGELKFLFADQLDIERQHFLAALIAQLKLEAPQVTPATDVMPLQQIELALLKDQAHIALMPGYRRIDGLEYHTAFSTPVYLCCCQNHPLFEEALTEVALEKLQKYEVIHPGVDINPEGRKHLAQLNTAGKAYQFDIRLAMILSGAWMGFLPEPMAKPLINKSELRYINPSTINYAFEQFFVSKKSPRDERLVRLVVETIQRQLETGSPLPS
ncbi:MULTISPECIES: LysR family transcriptional regulator [Gammaproteobacteria]|uniref:LysR family transcriptional regulator n=1 Tax=Gammaproteobacteria TaxID=1236 RepID=UPI000DD0481C|nr:MULTISPECIES: LysR family transcriptional regulator [Gammaproteobacteria]RTE85825.1 LysR family transcriptional regulator [Aliidiomarina sp. B3213]TCZ90174.1 LysR family transcriptional regulator [Lysobacter sp. N42]